MLGTALGVAERRHGTGDAHGLGRLCRRYPTLGPANVAHASAEFNIHRVSSPLTAKPVRRRDFVRRPVTSHSTSKRGFAVGARQRPGCLAIDGGCSYRLFARACSRLDEGLGSASAFAWSFAVAADRALRLDQSVKALEVRLQRQASELAVLKRHGADQMRHSDPAAIVGG